jgi:hypothetical protein
MSEPNDPPRDRDSAAVADDRPAVPARYLSLPGRLAAAGRTTEKFLRAHDDYVAGVLELVNNERGLSRAEVLKHAKAAGAPFRKTARGYEWPAATRFRAKLVAFAEACLGRPESHAGDPPKTRVRISELQWCIIKVARDGVARSDLFGLIEQAGLTRPTPDTLTRAVSRLARRGLVRRYRSPGGYCKCVATTHRGKLALARREKLADN